MATAKKSVTVKFTRERETQNTVRFAEVTEEGADKLVGVLYVQKPTAVALGNPEHVKITLEASE